jgi:hypothetical protein
MFFASELRRFLTIVHQHSPQIHHQKTTICHHVFAKTPVKTPFHHPQKNNSKAEALPSFF